MCRAWSFVESAIAFPNHEMIYWILFTLLTCHRVWWEVYFCERSVVGWAIVSPWCFTHSESDLLFCLVASWFMSVGSSWPQITWFTLAIKHLYKIRSCSNPTTFLYGEICCRSHHPPPDYTIHIFHDLLMYPSAKPAKGRVKNFWRLYKLQMSLIVMTLITFCPNLQDSPNSYALHVLS